MSSSTNQSVPLNQLADRFRQVTGKTPANVEDQEYEKVQNMTLEELSKECINFGKTYVGRLFPTMMSETRYVTWFVNNYKDSRRPGHAKFIKYIQLYVADKEKNPLQAKTKGKAAPSQSQGYYVEKMMEPPTPTSQYSEAEESDPMDPLPNGSWEEVEPPLLQQPNVEMQIMQERLHQMEEMMQQVLHHLNQQANQNQGK